MRLGVTKAKSAQPPAWVKPQLAKLVEKAPDGPEWLHEIKFDGYRMHARTEAGRVQILTRRGNDWTNKYPAIAKAVAGLPAQNAYLDGELCGVLPSLSPVLPGVEFELMRMTLSSGVNAGTFPPHRAGSREYLAVETGTLTLLLDGAEYFLHAGDSIYHDGDCEYGYRNDADTPCTYYLAMDIAGK